VRADADRALDGDAAFLEGVVALGKVRSAEEAETERAFEAGMRAAAFDAAEAGPVAMEGHGPCSKVFFQVDALGVAPLAGADRLVIGDVVGVGGAEGPAAVLAGVFGEVGAPG